MLESYHTDTLPQLLQELEDIYNDLCATVSEAVMQSTEVISGKVSVAREMGHGWCHVYSKPRCVEEEKGCLKVGMTSALRRITVQWVLDEGEGRRRVVGG